MAVSGRTTFKFSDQPEPLGGNTMAKVYLEWENFINVDEGEPLRQRALFSSIEDAVTQALNDEKFGVPPYQITDEEGVTVMNREQILKQGNDG